MDINIKSDREEELTRQLANETGESLAEALMQIGRRCAALPDLDTRDADEILGHDKRGDAVRDEDGTRPPLGSRLAARFARVGLTQEEIPELRGQSPRPADFES